MACTHGSPEHYPLPLEQLEELVQASQPNTWTIRFHVDPTPYGGLCLFKSYSTILHDVPAVDDVVMVTLTMETKPRPQPHRTGHDASYHIEYEYESDSSDYSAHCDFFHDPTQQNPLVKRIYHLAHQKLKEHFDPILESVQLECNT